MFYQKVALHRAHYNFPTMLCLSFILSLVALCEAFCIIQSRQSAENSSRHGLRTGWAEFDLDELSLRNTIYLVFKAGLGSKFSSTPGEHFDANVLEEVLWALKPPSTLETLILEENHIQDIMSFADVLQANQTLLHLDLSENQIQNWAPLAEALK